MWSRFGGFTQRISPSFRRVLVTTSIPACLAASIITTSSNDRTERMYENRILADKHRVALAGWPVHQSTCGNANDDRINTLEALTKYLKDAGYDGMELKFGHFKAMYFKDSLLSDSEIAAKIKAAFDKEGLRIFGVLLHSQDEFWDSHNVDKYLSDLNESLVYNKAIGAEYVTFQIWLPQKYLYGDGSYRNNERLLEEYVDRIKSLQSICYANGLNFYVETHVGRLSEDPEAFSKIIDGFKDGSFEINGDLSHYICRGMLKGPFVDKILNKMEHTHVRMARIYGDLSVNVDDPIQDWQNDGVTKDYWKFTKKGFENGLSSRVIVGESGPMHLVSDCLKQDKKMVPFLRAMARYCDLQIQQNNYDAEDFNPFEAQ